VADIKSFIGAMFFFFYKALEIILPNSILAFQLKSFEKAEGRSEY